MDSAVCTLNSDIMDLAVSTIDSVVMDSAVCKVNSAARRLDSAVVAVAAMDPAACTCLPVTCGPCLVKEYLDIRGDRSYYPVTTFNFFF